MPRRNEAGKRLGLSLGVLIHDREIELMNDWAASPREVEAFLAKRKGGKMLLAAADLGISPRTLEAHLRSLYRRVGVHSFTELEAKLRGAVIEDREST